MLTDFDTLPPTARVWVYQAARPLSEAEENSILSAAQTFLVSWTAHSHELKAAARIAYGHFLVLAVDESHNAASGCSIDKSVHFVQSLESQFSVSFFDRTKQAFLMDGSVQLVDLKDLKNAVESGEIASNTLAFNNLTDTIGALKTHWLQPASQTWLKRYFTQAAVS